jgi:tRNA C32,U32 (ribose-2'-O)-methylase TrmJ
MRRLVRERCDFLVRLPTRPAQPTLNVSNAAAVALYELNRCRTTDDGEAHHTTRQRPSGSHKQVFRCPTSGR